MLDLEEELKKLDDRKRQIDLDFLRDLIPRVIKEIKEEKPTTKRWRAELGYHYHYVTTFGEIEEFPEHHDGSDNWRFFTHNYFETREDAEKHLEKIKVYYELKDLADELNGDRQIDWKDETQLKMYLYYDFDREQITESWTCSCREIAQIYCLDNNFLDVAKECIGEDRLKLLFEGD